MSKTDSELKNILEAALLVSREPLTVEKLLSMFSKDSQPKKEDIKKTLDALAKDYEGRGIELKKIDKGYRFQSMEKYGPWIARLTQERPPRYSRALLETISIIAYRQPVTRGDIEDVRGITVSTEIMRTLQDREWIRQVGHRDVPGKPALFGTTRAFLEHFSLSSLDQLPPLSELRDIEEISKEVGLVSDFAGKPEAASASASEDASTNTANTNDNEDSADLSLSDDNESEAEVVEMQASSHETSTRYE